MNCIKNKSEINDTITRVLTRCNEPAAQEQKSELLEESSQHVKSIKERLIIKRPGNEHGFGAFQFPVLMLPLTGARPLQNGEDNVYFQSFRGNKILKKH